MFLTLSAAAFAAGSGSALLAQQPAPQTPKALAAEPKPIPPEQFDKIHKLILPQTGESRWREIPWLTSTWEARKKAAAEGKPIFIWYAGGAAPIGGC